MKNIKKIKNKNIFADGGNNLANTDITNKSTQANAAWGSIGSGTIGMGTQFADNLKTPEYKANQYQFTDTNSILAASGNINNNKADTTSVAGSSLAGAGSGALAGAGIGTLAGGPVGTLVGGVIGGVVGAVGGLATSIFGNKAKEKAAKEANEKNQANFNAAAETMQADNIMKNLNTDFALGGNLFSKGGAIHINPANKGKFNALKARTGKTTEELTHSKNPLTRKRAIFAQNASHWNHSHADGGFMLPYNLFSNKRNMFEDGGNLIDNNLYSEGGYVPFSNGVTEFNVGGTHEENPYDGIPQGIAPDNKPNLVEEGEVKYDNYIYSDRLKPSEKLLRQVGLPTSYKDKSFGSIAKSLSEESKDRPNDIISNEGLKVTMGRLKEAQEVLKNKKAASLMSKLSELGVEIPTQDNNNTPTNNDQVNNIPYALGGKLDYNNAHIAKDGLHLITLPAKWEDSLSMEVEPFKPYKFPDNVNKDSNAFMNIPLVHPKDTGFRFGNYQGGNNVNSQAPLLSTNYQDNSRDLSGTTPTVGTNTSNTNYNLGLDESILRYAPILGNAIGLLGNKKDYTHANEIGNAQVSGRQINNYLGYTPLDRNYYTNQLTQNNAANRSFLRNASGGNRANYMANAIAADYGYNIGLGNLARQSEEYNNNEKEKVQTFNRGTNEFNAQQSNWAQGINNQNAVQSALLKEQIDAQYDAAKSQGITHMFDNIGNIGREAYSRNMIITNPANYYSIDRTGKVSYNVKNYMDATGITDKNKALQELMNHYKLNNK